MSEYAPQTRPRTFFLRFLVLVFLFLTFNTLVFTGPANAGPGQTPFFSLNSSLTAGQTIATPYLLPSGTRPFNFSLTVSGSGPVQLEITNGSGGAVWMGTAQAGETVWGFGTLTTGNNNLKLTNQGAAAANASLKLYDIPTAPYNWSGVANGSGLNSQARVTFPTSGLYTFTYTVGSGRFQFEANTNHLQKTVESNGSVVYYIPAGTHTFTIDQNSTTGASWGLNITGPGATNDSLPYTKSGGNLGGVGNDFNEEWLPIDLTAASSINLAFTATGSGIDDFTIEAYNPSNVLITTINGPEAGETLWSTFDLPAGTNRLRLLANGGNTASLAYNLTVHAVPTTVPYSWDGNANMGTLNSHIRLNFPTTGRYTFALNIDSGSGRYQFGLDNDYILKTVEDDTSVAYYVTAGVHDLYIEQDDGTGANWSVGITLAGSGNDTLPYSKSGGDIGGTGNDFSEEWLPVALGTTTTANLLLELAGSPNDRIIVELYNTGSTTPDFVLDGVFGSENVWANFTLTSGVNRLHLITAGTNSGVLSYDLSLSTVPTAGTVNWSGSSRGANPVNSETVINFPSTGVYHFVITNTVGFANLVLDSALLQIPPTNGLTSGYDVQVTAGNHTVYVVQDPAFASTDWAATVRPVTSGPGFFTFSGTIGDGIELVPEYPVLSGTLDFNFALTTTGDAVELEIVDESNVVLWSGTALNGETLWGTGTLSNGTNAIHLTNVAGGAAASVDLTLYYIPTAPYNWDGNAAAAGLNSEIRVNFATPGLYTFTGGLSSGRYQFLVNNNFIQKTIETNNTSVAYFVPNGTHTLVIDQSTTAGSNWNLAVSGVGATTNTLPYNKTGGNIGGPANDFTQEWLTINLAAAAQVNMATTLAGTSGDSLEIEVYNPSSALITTTTIYAGEMSWDTFDLPAGTSRLHLVADAGNAAALTYTNLSLSALPTPALTLTGIAYAGGENSQVRVAFPNGGLYTFSYAAFSGRYQFLLNDEFIQKTVEADGSVVYYVPAGTHELAIVQDDASGANWALNISAVAGNNDTLPYAKSGGNIGGTGNDFTEEWLPIHLGTATQVNVEVTLIGAAANNLQLEIVNASGTTILNLDPLFGTETVWATVDLPSTTSRFHLLTDGANTGNLAYSLTVHPIPAITGLTQDSYSWDGRSLSAGINGGIRLNTVISGTYRLDVAMPNGFAALYIDSTPPPFQATNVITYVLFVNLDDGMHTFITDQSGDTDWTITATLDVASAPEVYSTNPVSGTIDAPTNITITGFNFMPGATVALQSGATTHPLGSVTYISSSQLTAIVPAGLPVGLYDVVVTNPDAQEGTLVGGFEVYDPIHLIYLPIILKP
ncbi:MAG: IPT/TIG domain-containing protein [Chloroflexi bacterium]|nr:IPT/TIG domain-containing protein [Chloroflexota bacterium]MBP8055235.1 IPT/TIG domain-containing protein [Chloroflexota bacterium]